MNSTQFKETYYPFHTKLYRIAYRLLMDVESAEDIVQETFLKLWDNRVELEKIETPEAYAITMLRNMCLNQIRARKIRMTIQYDYEIPEEGSLIANIEDKDKAGKLLALIDMLPEQQRDVITYRHINGYTYEEIEQEMDLNVQHLRVLLSRARKTLKEQFSKIEQL